MPVAGAVLTQGASIAFCEQDSGQWFVVMSAVRQAGFRSTPRGVVSGKSSEDSSPGGAVTTYGTALSSLIAVPIIPSSLLFASSPTVNTHVIFGDPSMMIR